LTGTSLLSQLIEAIAQRAERSRIAPPALNLALFEKTDDFGPGFPHNEQHLLPFHITNMCAGDMGVYAARPGDFQTWIDRNPAYLQKRFPDYPPQAFEPERGPDLCRHYPRAFMGEYLRTRFQEAIRQARRLNLPVTLYPRHEIINVERKERLVRLQARSDDSKDVRIFDTDAVLLATGHWITKDNRKNYFDSPWPAERLLSGIPAGANVAVIGTSLSAIETALTLTSDGNFIETRGGGLRYIPSGNPRRVHLYSRRGLLPKVRGQVGAYANQYLTPAAFETAQSADLVRTSLEQAFALLNQELEAAYGRQIDWDAVLSPAQDQQTVLAQSLREAEHGDEPGGTVIWQTVLRQIVPYIRDWYVHLASSDRLRFDREFTSVFFTHVATQPHINAAKLLALMKAGLVQVIRLGRHYRFYRDDSTAGYRFDYTDALGRPTSDVFPFVVNARGQNVSIETDRSELAQNLIRAGYVRSGPVEMPADLASKSEDARKSAKGAPPNPSGTLPIDPETGRVRSLSSQHSIYGAVYAVGAMTRGQIIDASMAHGLCRSTAAICKELLEALLWDA